LAAAAVAALVVLTGCAVGPQFEQPPAPEVPTYLPGKGADRVAGRRLVAGEVVPSQWWKLFRSPRLNGLIEDGIAFNADLQAAEAAVRAAQANALAQRGALFPVMGAGFNASRQLTPDLSLQTNAANGASLYNLYTAQVAVTFVPDVWGGTRRQIESAEALAEVQASQRDAVYLTLVSNLALAAIETARVQAQIEAARDIGRTQTNLLTILRRQRDEGQIATPDVATQETAVAQSRLLLPPLEKQLAQQQHLLAALTGRFPAELGRVPFSLGALSLPRRLPLVLPADLVRQRPDVRAAEAQLHSANAQIGVAIANRLPQIQITGNGGSTALQLAQLLNPGTGFWTVAGSVAHTVFDAGTLQYKQIIAEENTRQAFEQYRMTVLTAVQNVANVLAALNADARALSAALLAEKAARENLDLSRKLVEQGHVSAPLLLAAQQAYLQTKTARIDAQAAQLVDTVALFQALGGGWQPPKPEPASDM
jgi:NodT family efflux transporter outer membrane factor (OMF) lipoprotein